MTLMMNSWILYEIDSELWPFGLLASTLKSTYACLALIQAPPNVIIVLREVIVVGHRFLQLFPNVKASQGMANFEGLFEDCVGSATCLAIEGLTVIIKSQTTTRDV